MLSKQPQLATMRMVQTKYKELFERVIQTKEPLFLLKGADPKVVVIDLESYNSLVKNVSQSLQEHTIKKHKKTSPQQLDAYLSGLSDDLFEDVDPVEYQKTIRSEWDT